MCPNGHMGYVMDGTFIVIDGMLQVLRSGANTGWLLSEMQKLAVSAVRGERDPEAALEDLTQIAPRELSAAIQQFRTQHPLFTALLILQAIVAIVGAAATAYRAFLPPEPAPPAVIINNNTTIINEAAPQSSGSEAIPKALKREQMRRLKQMERKKEKLRRQGQTET